MGKKYAHIFKQIKQTISVLTCEKPHCSCMSCHRYVWDIISRPLCYAGRVGTHRFVQYNYHTGEGIITGLAPQITQRLRRAS
jgi:hypothetical protein